MMKITPTDLPEVNLLELTLHQDARGGFAELFSQKRYAQAGIGIPFVQDNWSHSFQNSVRGLHLQPQYPQGKLITVVQGHIWDVVVDINPTSPNFGEYITVELFGLTADEDEEREEGQALQQLWIPPGYAHGFCVLSETATVLYKCTEVYHPEDESGVLWSDADLDIPWPVDGPIVSKRDQGLPTLQQWCEQYS